MPDSLCPKCGEEMDRDSVDVGVGVIYGPYGCICGYSENPMYDRSEGPSPAQLEHPDWYVDSRGSMISHERIAENLSRFGIDGERIANEVFKDA